MTFHLNGGEKELAEILSTHKPEILLLDFYAQWCGPCKRISPLLETYLKDLPQVLLVKIDVDVEGNEDIVKKYSVRAMPTFVWFSQTGSKRMEGANIESIKQITQELLSSSRE